MFHYYCYYALAGFFAVSDGDVNALSSKEHIILEFLKQVVSLGILNDTFLIIGGDHGFRRGDYLATNAGAYEAR